MRRFFTMLFAFCVIGTFSACSAGTDIIAVSKAPVTSAEATGFRAESTHESEGITVDMVYDKMHNNDHIMASCYTEESISLLGDDQYTVYLGEAKIYNVQGDEIAIEDLVPGCSIRVQCEDQVYASMPPLLHAWTVTVLSEEAIADY